MGFLLWLLAVGIFFYTIYKAIQSLANGDPLKAIGIFIVGTIIACLVGPLGVSVFDAEDDERPVIEQDG